MISRLGRRSPLRWALPPALAAALIAIGCAPPTTPSATTEPDTPPFVEAAAAAGVSHTYTGDWTYFVVGGVATFDCDADLFVAGGADPSALFRNETSGTLAFKPVDSPTVQFDAVTGAYPLDIDADGVMDIVVLRAGENLLLHGLGDCAFRIADAEFGLDGGDGWTTAFSATWEHDNRLPTLAFGNYVDRDDPDGPFNAREHYRALAGWLHRALRRRAAKYIRDARPLRQPAAGERALALALAIGHHIAQLGSRQSWRNWHAPGLGNDAPRAPRCTEEEGVTHGSRLEGQEVAGDGRHQGNRPGDRERARGGGRRCRHLRAHRGRRGSGGRCA